MSIYYVQGIILDTKEDIMSNTQSVLSKFNEKDWIQMTKMKVRDREKYKWRAMGVQRNGD